MAYGIYYMWYIIALLGGRVGWWFYRLSPIQTTCAQARPAEMCLNPQWIQSVTLIFIFSVSGITTDFLLGFYHMGFKGTAQHLVKNAHPQINPEKTKIGKEISAVSHSFSPKQLWDLFETSVRLWLIFLRNRCRKSQLGLPVIFKGDLIKLSMKFQNVSPVLERSKV